MADNIQPLAEAAGIAVAYQDIDGTMQATAPETLLALLQALGVAAETDQDRAQSLLRLEAETWSPLAPPVHVVRADRPAPIPITTAAPPGALLHWQVRLEDGAVASGQTVLQTLDRLATGPERFAGHGRYALGLAAVLTDRPGYHHLEMSLSGAGWGEQPASLPLIVAPSRVAPPGSDPPRRWGLAGQLYSLRRDGDWGLGDFTALAEFAGEAGRLGADVFGLSPCHALFWAEPRHCGPYGPSSRLFLNPLHLDVTTIPELTDCPEAQALLSDPVVRAELDRLRAADRVDYGAVGALKHRVLEALYACFAARHLVPGAVSVRGGAFHDFRAARGRRLEDFARFEALHEHYYRGRGLWSWRDWPAAHRDPDTPAVADFAAAHPERVTFFAWLQWLSAAQLASADERARAAGARLGLYGDLAVADHPDGATAWSEQAVVVQGARVGAPPDSFNAAGQNWGLAPLHPHTLRARGYRLFIDTLRACLAPCGVLRLDHAMGLERLFWVPSAGGPGTYVRYPFEDLLNIVCLEATRRGCRVQPGGRPYAPQTPEHRGGEDPSRDPHRGVLVVGEDLGTVSSGFRASLAERGILSYRVLYFERDAAGEFLPLRDYPAQALATPNTHDLPTLAGFWLGRDWRWRRSLGAFSDHTAEEAALAARVLDRLRLIRWLEATGVVEPGRLDPFEGPDRHLGALVAQALAAAPSALLLASLEDVFGLEEQPNLPGTVDEHPNWCRRLPGTAAQMAAVGGPLLQALARGRPR